MEISFRRPQRRLPQIRKQQNQPRHMEKIGSFLTTAPPPPNQKTAKPAETHGKNRLPLDHSAASPKPENSKTSRDTWKISFCRMEHRTIALLSILQNGAQDYNPTLHLQNGAQDYSHTLHFAEWST